MLFCHDPTMPYKFFVADRDEAGIDPDFLDHQKLDFDQRMRKMTFSRAPFDIDGESDSWLQSVIPPPPKLLAD